MKFESVITVMLAVLTISSVSWGYTVMDAAAHVANAGASRQVASDDTDTDEDCTQSIVTVDGDEYPVESCE